MLTDKQVLRQKVLKRMRAQSARRRLEGSLTILRRLRRLTLYRQARVVLCYVAVDGEVETRPLLRRILADGKRLVVPVAVPAGRRLAAAEIRDPEKDLQDVGPFGIPQPARLRGCRVSVRDLDLVIVPGVAFDAEGRRLGRGGGYFDRFLERIPARVPRVGLAFRFQVVRALPWEPHDRPVWRVITDGDKPS